MLGRCRQCAVHVGHCRCRRQNDPRAHPGADAAAGCLELAAALPVWLVATGATAAVDALLRAGHRRALPWREGERVRDCTRDSRLRERGL